MDRWVNKVAVVTGASAGIGATIANDLLQAGLKVVALARREEILLEHQKAFPSDLKSRYYPRKCDATSEPEVLECFRWIEDNLGGVDVLINNAGIVRVGVGLACPKNTQTIRDVVETNLMSVIYCTREAFDSMRKRNFSGHIVVLNSIAGHKTPNAARTLLNIYPGTKHALRTMVESYRQEFINAGTKVKITTVSPGSVETGMIQNVEALKKKGVLFLTCNDVSRTILYVLQTPPHVQVNQWVHEIVITPINET